MIIISVKKKYDSMGHSGATGKKSQFSLVKSKTCALKGYYQQSSKTSIKGANNFFSEICNVQK